MSYTGINATVEWYEMTDVLYYKCVYGFMWKQRCEVNIQDFNELNQTFNLYHNYMTSGYLTDIMEVTDAKEYQSYQHILPHHQSLA